MSGTFAIRKLQERERATALALFCRAMVRDWPVPAAEVRQWVEGEFNDPTTVLSGAFDGQGNLVGTISLVQLDRSLSEFPQEEHRAIQNAFTGLKRDMFHALFVGGLAVNPSVEGRGVARTLFDSVTATARGKGAQTLVAVTARPSPRYPAIRGLAISRHFGFSELPLPHPFFHESPPDLERVWLYQELDPVVALHPEG